MILGLLIGANGAWATDGDIDSGGGGLSTGAFAYNSEQSPTQTFFYDPQRGEITITFRRQSTSGFCYSTNPPTCESDPDVVWKEIYGVKDGKLQLIKRIEGKVIPAQEERIEWEE